MSTAQKPKTTKESYALNFWRLFHCFLRHGRTDEELLRTKATWSWMTDNMVNLSKVCIDVQLDLLQAVWTVAMETQDLPGYDIVLEKVQGMEKNEAILDALKEYKEFEPNLTVHDPEDLPDVFRDLATDWEKERITTLLKLTNRIVNGNLEEGKQKWAGPKDGIHYLMRGLEEGCLLTEMESVRPIVVQKDTGSTGTYYDETKRKGFLQTGFEQFQFQPGNFVGVLGYSGDGKSTTTRFILYNIALSGKNVLLITLENDEQVERNKFVIMHAHHPKFQGEFNKITYERFKKHLLSYKERQALDDIDRDFSNTVPGMITIRQPMTASWPHCRTIIETEHLVNPLHAAGIDYLQLIDPPTVRNEGDQRARMTAMIKDVRQYGLHFDNKKKLMIISPVQSNEEGLKKAQDNEGVWTLSGVNNDKELGRSMDYLVGVCGRGKTSHAKFGEVHEMVLSCAKDRDGLGFNPFFAHLTGAGWIIPAVGGPKPVPLEDESTLNDVVDSEMMD